MKIKRFLGIGIQNALVAFIVVGMTFGSVASFPATVAHAAGTAEHGEYVSETQDQQNNDWDHSDRHDGDHNHYPDPSGSIRICKVVLDSNGEIADVDAVSGESFTIPGLDVTTSVGAPAPDILETTVITTQLEFNSRIFDSSTQNDAECVTYTDLAFGNYYYGQEIISDSVNWETPVYHDEVGDFLYTQDYFAAYSGELFDNDPANDCERNVTSDGHIVIDGQSPMRTLVIINKMKAAVTPPPPPPSTTNGALEITKYSCPEGIIVTRAANGPDINGFATVPNGCTAKEGISFGYIYESNRANGDLTSPYPGWDDGAAWTVIGSTNASGKLTMANLNTVGRYDISELLSNGAHLPETPDTTLGFFCNGDTGREDDNYDIIFPSANTVSHCVVYNLAIGGQGGSNGNGGNSGNTGDSNGTGNTGGNGGSTGGTGGNTGGTTGGSIGGGISTTAPGQVLGVSTCGIYIKDYLRYGYKNDPMEVKKLQTFLNSELGLHLAVSGKFDINTEAAVHLFQRRHFIKVLEPWNIIHSTGIVYLTTKTEINNVYCLSLNLPVPQPLINWSQNPETASIPQVAGAVASVAIGK